MRPCVTPGLKIGSTTGYTDEMMAVVTRVAADKGYAAGLLVRPQTLWKTMAALPFMLFKNLETLGVHSVHNAVKIGDTVSDILEGKNAGVVSIGVVRGSSEMGLTEEEFNHLCDDDKATAINKVTKTFRDAGADYVIQDLSELIPLIKTLDEQ